MYLRRFLCIFLATLWACSEDKKPRGPEDEVNTSKLDVPPVCAETEESPFGVSGFDVLFVIDKSFTMREEQDLVAREISEFVDELSSAGVAGFAYRFGVVTTDLGIGRPATDEGSATFSCDVAGDDARLRTEIPETKSFASIDLNPVAIVDGDERPCEELEEEGRLADDEDSYLELSEESTEAELERLRLTLACRVQVGIGGCGFEQQLEAGLKAIASSDSELTFVNTGNEEQGGLGAPSGANAGFLREDTALLLVFVTDEDDCSSKVPLELFAANREDADSTENPYDTTELNQELRCYDVEGRNDSNALYDIERYVEGFYEGRRCAEHVSVAFLTGVPAEAVNATDAPNYETILGLEAMQHEAIEVGSASGFTRKAPQDSCEGPNGKALPPRRMMRFGQAMQDAGALTRVASVCESTEGFLQQSFEAAVEALTP